MFSWSPKSFHWSSYGHYESFESPGNHDDHNSSFNLHHQDIFLQAQYMRWMALMRRLASNFNFWWGLSTTGAKVEASASNLAISSGYIFRKRYRWVVRRRVLLWYMCEWVFMWMSDDRAPFLKKEHFWKSNLSTLFPSLATTLSTGD